MQQRHVACAAVWRSNKAVSTDEVHLPMGITLGKGAPRGEGRGRGDVCVPPQQDAMCGPSPMLGMVHAQEAIHSWSTNGQCTAVGSLSTWLSSNCGLLLQMHHILLHQVCSWPAPATCCVLPLWLPLAVVRVLDLPGGCSVLLLSSSGTWHEPVVQQGCCRGTASRHAVSNSSMAQREVDTSPAPAAMLLEVPGDGCWIWVSQCTCNPQLLVCWWKQQAEGW